jgi:ADP-ribose pyrophosphatase YjhB (NUDIX family)
MDPHRKTRVMGFPGGTVDLPGPARPELADIIADAHLDPYGHGERLAAALRGEVTVAPGHLATNAWVFDTSGDRLLLVRHRRLGWVNPGGHLDLGEWPVQGAARELAEETGLRVAAVDLRPAVVRAAIFPAGDGPAHWHWNIHHLFVADPDDALTPEEGSPVQWFPVDDLPEDRVGDLDELLALLLPLLS